LTLEKTGYPTAPKTETCILVCVADKNNAKDKSEEYLEELELLASTAGAITIKKIVQKLIHPDPKTYIGKGKVEELALFVKDNKVDLVIFDDELSPSQIRNIENNLPDIKIMDRSGLILDIFAKNAKTAQASLQVELAQMQYLMPRLTKMWTHLTKHAGGIGTRGPGEKEIETDRRIIRNNINILRDKLKKIEQQSEVQRKNRHEKINISLIGYTNAGKSTVMNALTQANVLAENKLFATLDATVRQWQLQNEEGTIFHCLLADTVGFIRKLPHTLIESFKSTLAVAKEADILLHVVDVSHPEFENHIEIVNDTLKEIGVLDKQTILVLNKIDLLEKNLEENIKDFKNNWISKENWPVVFISASHKTNINDLKNIILKQIENNAAFKTIYKG